MTGPIIAVMEPGTFEAATKGFIFLRLGAARGLQVGQSSSVILFNTSASLVQSGEVGGRDNEKVRRRRRLQSRSITSAALFPFTDVVTEQWTVLIPEPAAFSRYHASGSSPSAWLYRRSQRVG